MTTLHIDRRVLALNSVGAEGGSGSPAERDALRRQVIRQHKAGAQPCDLAVLHGLDEREVRLILFGGDIYEADASPMTTTQLKENANDD